MLVLISPNNFFSSGTKVASLFREWSLLSDRPAGTCRLALWLLPPAGHRLGPELRGTGALLSCLLRLSSGINIEYYQNTVLVFVTKALAEN